MLESSRAAKMLPGDTPLTLCDRRGESRWDEGEEGGKRTTNLCLLLWGLLLGAQGSISAGAWWCRGPGHSGQAPKTPRVTEKHIQEELVFLLTFFNLFLIFFSSLLSG